jgi:DNA transformation protein and related proteins
MPVSQEYLDYVIDQLIGLGPVKSKRMFGGAGLYLDGIFFGLVAEDVLYFKVDDTNKSDYVSAGSGPFKPFGNDSYEMSYYEAPGDVLEDPDLAREWAAKAVLVAQKKRRELRKKPASPGSKSKRKKQ